MFKLIFVKILTDPDVIIGFKVLGYSILNVLSREFLSIIS